MKRNLALAGIILFSILLGLDLTVLYGEITASGNTTDGPRKDMPPLIPGINAKGKAPPVIRLHDKETDEFFCSAIIVSANYAVTAAHCVSERSRTKPSIKIHTVDGAETPVEGIAAFYEGRSDTALILGDFSGFNHLEMATSPLIVLTILSTPGFQVIACGFPYGGAIFCTPFTERHGNLFGFAGSGYLYPGMSGGPVMVEQNGTALVVAINTSVTESGIYVSPLIELLAHAKVTEAK